MIVTMVIMMTVAGHNVERREVMPTIEACWRRAPEAMMELQRAQLHLTRIGVGCIIDSAEPI
jgi:hypothetical protein